MKDTTIKRVCGENWCGDARCRFYQEAFQQPHLHFPANFTAPYYHQATLDNFHYLGQTFK